MSYNKGFAVGGSGDILSLAVGGNTVSGAAYGEQIIFTKGSELFEVITVPLLRVNESGRFTLSCNRLTTYVVTYTVASNGSLSGISRSNVSYVDTPDGGRQISFDVAFGTPGNRLLRVYGATSSSFAVNNRSVNYIDIPVYVGSALMSSMPTQQPGEFIEADPFDYTVSSRIIRGELQPDLAGDKGNELTFYNQSVGAENISAEFSTFSSDIEVEETDMNLISSTQQSLYNLEGDDLLEP